jgi:APA family basic amino acid/polyamine antiporter
MTSRFEQVLTCAQFVLQFCSFLTVLGVFVLRFRQPNLARPYRTWGYPVTPLVFLAVSAWMLWHILHSKPIESMTGLGVAALGFGLYLLSGRKGASSPAIPIQHAQE